MIFIFLNIYISLKKKFFLFSLYMDRHSFETCNRKYIYFFEGTPNSSYVHCFPIMGENTMGVTTGRSPAWSAAIFYTPKISASVSVLGCLGIVMHISRQTTSTINGKKVFYFIMYASSIIDILTSTAMAFSLTPMNVGDKLLKPYERSYASGTHLSCSAQGFLINMKISVALWMSCLCTHYYLRIVLGKSEEDVQHKLIYFGISFILPFISSLVLLFIGEDQEGYSGMYGAASVWCWIERKSDLERFLFFYIPLWIAMVYTTIVMFLIVRSVEKTTASAQTESSERIVHDTRMQGVLYCASFLVTWMFGTIDRLVEAANIDSPLLEWLHVLMVPLQGFFNSMVYGRPFYLAWRRRIGRERAPHFGCQEGSVWNYFQRGVVRNLKKITGRRNATYQQEARRDVERSVTQTIKCKNAVRKDIAQN